MKALVVSLHDVSPQTREVFTAMLRELAEVGVTRTSLLVIPDHHHRGHLLDHPDFCDWLKGLIEQGHEPVIHGYYHQRDARPGETVRQRWVTGVYTTGEGEFFDLPKNEAASLLARAKTDFQGLDPSLSPSGFIAPAWLLGDAAAEAVREAGFTYTTYLTGVQNFRALAPTNGFLRSQSLVYSCRNWWRRASSLLWNATLRRRLQDSPLVRLGLHPPDYQHPGIWRQILRFAREEAARRIVMTYDAFVEQWWAGQSFPALTSKPSP